MKETQWRFFLVATGIFFLFGLLLIRFFQLQILEGDEWFQRAERQHFFLVKEPFRRGTFYAYKSVVKEPYRLAFDVTKFHLFADPKAIPEEWKGVVVEGIASCMVLSPQEKAQLHQSLASKTRSKKLRTWLSLEEKETLIHWWRPFAKRSKIASNGLFFVKDYQRSYPGEHLLGHLLHTIQHQKEETTLQAKPTGGLELFFDPWLKGRLGRKKLLRSPRHALETTETLVEAEDGADIYLTIDPYLQAIAEEEVEAGVKSSSSKRGWAALMDPYTGELLASAQYPFFDLSHYSHFLGDPILAEEAKMRAMTDMNEPGSIFKPFTATLALVANQLRKAEGKPPLFSVDEKIATSSGRFPGRSKPIRDTKLHHFLNFDMGMQKSSNIYMGRLAERIIQAFGNAWYRKQLENLFGLGEKTGIEWPAESPGHLPIPGKRHPNGKLEWSVPTPFSLAMGYNVQVTTLQILRAYSVLANGGYLVKPTLVKKIVQQKRDGTLEILVDHTDPKRTSSFPRTLDPWIVQRVVEAMRYVTKPGGTAVKADVPGYSEVGKTSTTEKLVNGVYSKTHHCATFAGFIPVHHPKFVIVVVMDEPECVYIPGVGKNHHGGNCTAKAFQKIALRALEYAKIPPDDPFGYPPGDKRRNAKRADWIPETERLQALYQSWNTLTPSDKKITFAPKYLLHTE